MYKKAERKGKEAIKSSENSAILLSHVKKNCQLVATGEDKMNIHFSD